MEALGWYRYYRYTLGKGDFSWFDPWTDEYSIFDRFPSIKIEYIDIPPKTTVNEL